LAFTALSTPAFFALFASFSSFLIGFEASFLAAFGVSFLATYLGISFLLNLMIKISRSPSFI